MDNMKKRVVALVCATSMFIGGNGGVSAEAAGAPVSLSKTSITMKEGTSKTITVKKTGKVSIKKKTFKTSNKKVATVTKKGMITAKKAGKATIKAELKYKKGKKTRSTTLKCQVTVKGKGSDNNKGDHSASTAAPIPAASQNPSGTGMPTEAPAAPGKPMRAAGLYDQDGKLIKTWDELKQEDRITVADGVIKSSSPGGLLGELVIGEEVKIIGGMAFLICDGLTSVTIPEGVTGIESGAFWGCGDLASVTIPDSVTNIGENAFLETAWFTKEKAEKDFVIGGKILISAGKKDNGDIIIPESVNRIGECAFWNCSGLTGVTIPKGVTSIGYLAFSGCSSLTSVTISEGVTSIEMSAFSGCSSLASVTIPDSVTSVGTRAFEETAWFTKEKAEKDFVIGGKILISAGKKDSGDIVIPEGVASIGEEAFYECRSLTGVTIPEGVTSIERGAFANCSNLASVTIPDSVTSIERAVFAGTAWLTKERVENDFVISGGILIYAGKKDSGDIVIPEGVTSIVAEAFSICRNLTSVTVPESVTSIGDYTFC